MIDYTVTIDERRRGFRCPNCGSTKTEQTSAGSILCANCNSFFDCASTTRTDMPTAPDPVNHPPHYTRCGYECAEVVIALGLSYCLGNVLKYVWRCGHKSDALEDLRKARWYLDREIRRRESDGA